MKKLTISIALIMAFLMLSILFTAIPHANATITSLTNMSGDRIGEPMDIDPAWAYDTSSGELLMNVYDSLLFFNRTNGGSFIPRLATSWTITPIDEISPEGLHWLSRVVFTIRTNVHFQDTSPHSTTVAGAGALLTPQDVEYSYERVLVADAGTGPSWMLWDPFMATSNAYALNTSLAGVGETYDANGFDTKIAGMIEHAVSSDATTVTCNLVMPYEPFLGIMAQTWGGILNQAWCVQHGDWPGFPDAPGAPWSNWHDLATSPLYSAPTAAPGPHIDAALGTGPYILDYWNKGAGNAWSIIKNDPSTPGIGSTYWEGWTITRHAGWGSAEPAIGGHVVRYTSNYIPEWSTRRLRFLGGLSDFCDVPRNYMGQVATQPGIECIFPLAQLACDACFLNYAVASTSTFMGVMQPAGTFSQYGAPPDIMTDINFRLAIAHMFDYTTFLYAAYLNESVSPVTPIIPGLAYYDPAIGKMQTCAPLPGQLKEYGITGNLLEPAGQKAYDLVLAETYLRAAFGGALWANGFTFSAAYNEGNIGRQIGATLIRDAFSYFNALYGTKFTVNIVSVPWNGYSKLWRGRVLPYYIVGWLVDYPDAHDFAFPFMHSGGDFSRYQGFKGVTSFPNQAIDDHIAQGIGTVVGSERQGNYTWLQQEYVNECPSFTIDQVTGRHWQRDWVEGWYYNAIFPGNYIYDLWKAVGVTVQDVDVEITDLVCPTALYVATPAPGFIEPLPSPISVTVHRKDANVAVPSVLVIISISLVDSGGREVVLDVDLATLASGASYTIDFYSFLQDQSALITPGLYTVTARVLVVSGFAQDTDLTNNEVVQATKVPAIAGDVNHDRSIDMADISIMIDAFMSDSKSPNWNATCDLNVDGTVDMADISMVIDAFMQAY